MFHESWGAHAPSRVAVGASPTGTASVQAAWGPYFGKDEKQIVVAGKGGVHETTDGGQTWSLVATLPDPFKNPPGPGWYLNFAFDPVKQFLLRVLDGEADLQVQAVTHDVE